MSSPDLLRRVVLPVASASDAEATCEAAVPYLANADGEVHGVYVIETTPGAPNKAPPEAMYEYAHEALSTVEERCRDASIPVGTELHADPDVPETVFEVARDEGATAVGILPREGSRWGKLLTGDNALSMITRNDVPVVVFPAPTG
ncbi:MAG: universal stress protein [Halalkalicoccus sp.]